jgi:hypothetical protein
MFERFLAKKYTRRFHLEFDTNFGVLPGVALTKMTRRYEKICFEKLTKFSFLIRDEIIVCIFD